MYLIQISVDRTVLWYVACDDVDATVNHGCRRKTSFERRGAGYKMLLSEAGLREWARRTGIPSVAGINPGIIEVEDDVAFLQLHIFVKPNHALAK